MIAFLAVACFIGVASARNVFIVGGADVDISTARYQGFTDVEEWTTPEILENFVIISRTLEQLKYDVQRLDFENQVLQLQNKQLQSDMDDMKSQCRQLLSENWRLNLEGKYADRIRSKYPDVSNTRNVKYGKQFNLEAYIKALVHEEIGSCDKTRLNRPGNITDTIAFSSYVIHGWETYGSGDRIRFEGVQYNSGEYNAETSEFTCPTTGLYYFSVNINFFMNDTVGFSGRSEIFLQRANEVEEIAEVYSNSIESNDAQYDMGSNSVITMCTQGDIVYVNAVQSSRIFGVVDKRRSTFNGLLLAK